MTPLAGSQDLGQAGFFWVFTDGFESEAPPPEPPRAVLVAQSGWRGRLDFPELSTVYDLLTKNEDHPTESYCLQFAANTLPGWWEALADARCVFGYDEFDSPHTLRHLYPNDSIEQRIEWLNQAYSQLPADTLLVCNAACGAKPKRRTPRTAADIPPFPERCDVLACTPQYDAAWLPPLDELLAIGKPIMIWIDAYIPAEWGTCVTGSRSCMKAFERIKTVKVRQIFERYWNHPSVWGFDVFIGIKPDGTDKNSRDLRFLGSLKAYLESYMQEKLSGYFGPILSTRDAGR